MSLHSLLLCDTFQTSLSMKHTPLCYIKYIFASVQQNGCIFCLTFGVSDLHANKAFKTFKITDNFHYIVGFTIT